MRMRVGGQAWTLAWALACALGAVVAIGTVRPAAAACDDGSGCNYNMQNFGPQEPAAVEAEPAPAEKPLPLVSRKTGKPRAAKKAMPEKSATAKPTRNISTEQINNARAEARDAEVRKGSEGALTESDRAAAPATAEMPALSPDEASEIDHQAAAAEPPPASASAIRPASSAPQQTVPNVSQSTIDDRPRLATARVELPETTTVASSASQESTSWDTTSLIGKIFIALGGLLTAASAVRMFVG